MPLLTRRDNSRIENSRILPLFPSVSALVIVALAGGASWLAAPSQALAQGVPLRPSNLDAPLPVPTDPGATPDDAAAYPHTEAPPARGAPGYTQAPIPDAWYPEQPGLPPLPASGAANYGKPRILVPGRKPPKKTSLHPLPPLAPYPTSAEARRALRRDAPGGANATPDLSDPNYIAPSPTTAILPPPIPPKPKPRVDDDPFAPVGANLGLLRVKPYAEEDIGYADNPNQAPNGAQNRQGSFFQRQEIGGAAASDWVNHSFTGDFRLGYDEFLTDHAADAPDGSGKFTLRVDAARNTKINIDGKFDLSTQLQSSPNLLNNGASTALSSRPIIADGGVGLGATQTFNRLDLTLRGSVDRVYWADAHFADGAIQPLSRESYDDYGLTLRAAYELTPGVKPFVEGLIDRRDHDSLLDPYGYMRNSDGEQLRVGSTFELTRLLTGDIAVGYADRHYQDPRLADLRGPVFDSSLVWTVTPLTRVTLHGSTTMDETTVAGASGAITRSTSLEVAHALMRNVTLTASGGLTSSSYPGAIPTLNQDIWQYGLKAEYNLTRSVAIKGTFTHQRMLSNITGSDYTANIFMVGLKLQQ